MKCELCHRDDAQTAITRGEGDDEEELYVCHACAKAERQRRQKNSSRTRKVTGLPPGVSMSITEVGGETDEEAPPIIGAIMNAFKGIVSDIEKAACEQTQDEATKFEDFPVSRVDADYRIGGLLHLEGLHLIGEIDSVKRALHALRCEIVGVDADGVRDSGHVYRFRYAGSSERAKRIVSDLLREEHNARMRLFEEMHRVFSDALCRALAILRNCRLLSSGELFDLLSPLRLAAGRCLLDGVTLDEIEDLLQSQDLTSSEDRLGQEERDRIDAERADEMNRRFENVMVNEGT